MLNELVKPAWEIAEQTANSSAGALRFAAHGCAKAEARQAADFMRPPFTAEDGGAGVDAMEIELNVQTHSNRRRPPRGNSGGRAERQSC
jgi:hypothetical protein